MSRQGRWARRWEHTGPEVLGCKERNSCHTVTVWGQCPEEEQYQIRVVDMCEMMEPARKQLQTFKEVPSVMKTSMSE